jgi:hypothetical protein
MDQLRLAPHLSFRLLQDIEEAPRIGTLESPAGEEQTGAHFVPWTFRRLGSKFLQALAYTLLKVLMGDVASSIAHETPIVGKEPRDGQAEERRQDEPMG